MLAGASGCKSLLAVLTSHLFRTGVSFQAFHLDQFLPFRYDTAEIGCANGALGWKKGVNGLKPGVVMRIAKNRIPVESARATLDDRGANDERR